MKKRYVAQFDLGKLTEQDVDVLSSISKKFMVINGFIVILIDYGDVPKDLIHKVRVFASEDEVGKFTREIKRFLGHD